MLSGVITTIVLQPFANIKIALILPPKQLNLTNNFVKNFSLSYKFILMEDGWRGFYKGLVAATMKAALSYYIYFTGLRYL